MVGGSFGPVPTAPPGPGQSPVPRHVAWVARPARDGRARMPGEEERASLALVASALRLGVQWLTIGEPSGGQALRQHAVELATRGVAVLAGPEPPGAETVRRRELVELPSPPALSVLVTGEGSGRRELVAAVRELAARGTRPRDVTEATIGRLLGVPDVDLLVLTGGDRRVPDLLVWQVAYSEIVVLDDPWPQAAAAQFDAAVAEYQRRDRRYGGLVAPR